MKQKQQSKAVFANIAIGFQLGITISLFVLVGHFFDKKYNTTPWLLLLGAVLGMVIGFYHLIKELSSLKLKEENAKKSSKKSTKVKWM